MMGLPKSIRFAFAFFFTQTYAVFALTGIVVDESGNPIENVAIALLAEGSSTSTDSDGFFELNTTKIKHAIYANKHQGVKISRNKIHIDNYGDTRTIKIEKYRLNGQKAATIYSGMISHGKHCFLTKQIGNGSGYEIIRVFIDGKPSYYSTISIGQHKVFPASKGIAFDNIQSGVLIKKAGADIISDTALFMKAGHLPKRMTISSLYDSLGRIVLYDTTFEAALESMPLVDGSTTTISLSRLIFAKLLGISYRWKEPLPFWKTPGATFELWEIVPDTVDSQFYKDFILKTAHSKTHNAIMNVIRNEREIALVARIPSEDELDSATVLGTRLKWTPIALDALTIIVNSANQIQNLSPQNVRDIFSKNVINWEGVGGPDAEIIAYQRNPNSGSQEMMKTFVMKDTEIHPDLPILRAMGGVFELLHYEDHGICFTPYYYLEVQVRDSLIRSVSIDDFQPNNETISNRLYPFTAEVFAVTRSDLPEPSNAAKLIDWMLSTQGQDVIEESGYAPLLKDCFFDSLIMYYEFQNK